MDLKLEKWDHADEKGSSSEPEASRFHFSWLRPKLSVASMLWLTLLIAILILWYQDHKRLSNQISTINGGVDSLSWSIDQVKGAPDTLGFGDRGTAWASTTEDAREEWLVVEFPSAKVVTEVHVYETYNPGAVVRIYSVDLAGGEELLWQGTDPLAASKVAGGIAKIKLDQSANTRRLRIVIDSASYPGWNEIDAVKMVDTNGGSQWVSKAWASTSFGKNRPVPSWYWP